MIPFYEEHILFLINSFANFILFIMFFSPVFPQSKEEYASVSYNPTEQCSVHLESKEPDLDEDQFSSGAKVESFISQEPKHLLQVGHSTSQHFTQPARGSSRTPPTEYTSHSVNQSTLIPNSYQFPQDVGDSVDFYQGHCLTLQLEDTRSYNRDLQNPTRNVALGSDMGFFKCASPPLEVSSMHGLKSNSPNNIEYQAYQNYHIGRQYSPMKHLSPSNFPAISEPITPPESITSLHRHKILMSSDVSTSSGSTTNSIVSRNSRDIEARDSNKPRIETTYWEDEETRCYQVKARGFLVSRREDNNYVNGTKLLNVIGMSRGKRDGILKAEKNKCVIKLGSMNLKGVWIPFERAAEIARNNGVDGEALLGPLFIEDIKSYFETTGFKLRVNEAQGRQNRMLSPQINTRPAARGTLYLEMKDHGSN